MDGSRLRRFEFPDGKTVDWPTGKCSGKYTARPCTLCQTEFIAENDTSARVLSKPPPPPPPLRNQVPPQFLRDAVFKTRYTARHHARTISRMTCSREITSEEIESNEGDARHVPARARDAGIIAANKSLISITRCIYHQSNVVASDTVEQMVPAHNIRLRRGITAH